MAGVFGRARKQIGSLYTDPFRWGLVKSVGLFIVGVYLARDLKGVSLDAAPTPA